jgi:hypothetical protein
MFNKKAPSGKLALKGKSTIGKGKNKAMPVPFKGMKEPKGQKGTAKNAMLTK